MIERKVLFISDVHIPGHDRVAEGLIRKAAEDIGVTQVVFGGDILDFETLSKFTPSRSMGDDEAGYDTVHARGWMEEWREMFPKAKFDWIDGNHEWRLEKYQRALAPKIAGIVKTIPELLGFSSLRVTYHGHNGNVKIGKLTYVHGDQFRFGYGAVNPAKLAFDKTRESIIFGHFHRFSAYRHRGFSGKESGCWGNGCLQGVAQYDPNANWQRGATVVVYSRSGYFRVQPLEVIEGSLVYPRDWSEVA